jgi:regulator of sigma E protease
MITHTPDMGPVRALAAGTGETVHTFMFIIKSFRLLFSGIKLKNTLSGPLRITYYTGRVASTIFEEGVSTGLVFFTQFLGFISLALCFMNLLPIPVLDGGQILLFLFEIVKRSPLRPKMVYRYQLIGTVLVFSLIILATVNDIFFFAIK